MIDSQAVPTALALSRLDALSYCSSRLSIHSFHGTLGCRRIETAPTRTTLLDRGLRRPGLPWTLLQPPDSDSLASEENGKSDNAMGESSTGTPSLTTRAFLDVRFRPARSRLLAQTVNRTHLVTAPGDSFWRTGKQWLNNFGRASSSRAMASYQWCTVHVRLIDRCQF